MKSVETVALAHRAAGRDAPNRGDNEPVSALSLWALVTGRWSTWEAARVEVTQQQEADQRARNPIEEKVVDKIVGRTEISPS
jgi:hypothetical protein